MNLDDYRTSPDPMWDLSNALGDDGYDRMARAINHRWQPVPAWGTDNADLGDWPLVVIYLRTRLDGYDLAENIEGDTTQWIFPTAFARRRAITELAHRWTPMTRSTS